MRKTLTAISAGTDRYVPSSRPSPAHSLNELVRVTRPGGHIIYTLRPYLYEEGGFKEKHTELERAGKWKLAEVGEPTQILPLGEPDVFHQVWVFEVTA